MNVTSSTGFTPTLPVSQASANPVAPRGEQNPALQASSVKQAAESDRPDRKKQQQHRHHDATEKQQQQQDLQIIADLAARDREVRAHEQAHAAVGGVFAGSPSYTTEQGPNGVRYAVAGEVSISTSPVAGDAQATIRKADIVRRAALAPADPSAQDRAVAAKATQMKIKALAELARQTPESTTADGDKLATAVDAGQAGVNDDHARSRALLDSSLMTENALQQNGSSKRAIDLLI